MKIVHIVIISGHNVTYAFAREFAANRDEDNYVPTILHFLWVGKPIPEKYLDAVIGFEETNTDFEVTVDFDNKIYLKYECSLSDLLVD